MKLERLLSADARGFVARYLRTHGEDCAMVPLPRGEDGPVPDAWVSCGGGDFVSAPYDLSGVTTLLAGPVVDTVCERGGPEATADGRLLYQLGRDVIETRIGARLTFTRTGYAPPADAGFVRRALTVTEDGTWWAAGHWSRDSGLGMIFRSADGGATWTLVADKLPGSVGVLQHTAVGLVGLAFRSALRVTAEGVEVCGKYRDEVWHFVQTPAGLYGFGDGFVGFAAAPGKRLKYAELPGGGGGRARVAAVPGGFVLGRLGGLWASRDALTWEPVPGWNDHLVAGRTRRDATAVAPGRGGALVATHDGEVYRLTLDG